MSARRVQAAPMGEALEALDLILGWNGGWMPVFTETQERPPAVFYRRPCATTLTPLVRRLDEQWSEEITLGLPEPSRFAGGRPSHGVTGGCVLWVRVEGTEQLQRARKLRPLPTMVLQEGSSSRRLLLWSLHHRLTYDQLERANRRLAYAVKAVQKYGAPERLRVPAPGTCLRVGRSRPAPVVVTRLEPVSFAARDVVGRLKDPPEVDWRELTRKAQG